MFPSPSTPPRPSQQKPEPGFRHYDVRKYPYIYRKMGKVYNSPHRKRPTAKHAKKVVCPLKMMKKAALESKMASLMKPRSPPKPTSEEPEEDDQMDGFVEGGGTMEENDQEIGYSSEQDKEGGNEKKGKRDTKTEAKRLYDSWSALIPNLTTALLTYISKSTGKPTCTTFDTLPCQTCDPSLYSSTRITCLFWDHQDIVDIPSCACQSLPQVLVERGFFPTAPSQPRIAVSIDFLEFYNALFEHTGDAITAIASALANLYARRGYSVKTDEGQPIKDPFRRGFSSAVQWYDTLKAMVRRHVENAIEAAHIQLDSSQPIPPSPLSPHPSPIKGTTTGSEPPDAPTWDKPSSTDAARLLQMRCPACFGGRMTGRTFKEGADVHVAGDGNFHHRHAASAGHDSVNKVQDPRYFIPKDFVDKHGAHIESVRRRPVRQYQRKVPDSAVDDCEESLTAADEKKAKTNGEKFDDMGLAALVCRHDIPLFFVNIDTPGEQQKYMVALLAYLYSLLPPLTTVVCLYDVGCVLDRSMQLYDILPLQITSRLQFATSAMHAYGHQWGCQLIYNPRLQPGLGLTDGEGDARCAFQSDYQSLANIYSKRQRRLWYIDRQAAALNIEMRDGLGDWIGRRQRLGVERQGKEATNELKACGIVMETLRHQWEDQKETQLSLRAHAPNRLKKELDIVLGLQSDIDTVEAALSSTRSAVAHRKVPPETHQAIESLERNHARLLKNVESLYASLNVSNVFPELDNLSLDFVRTLLMARDLKINIRRRAVANFLEFDKLDRAVGGKQNPLGTKLHQQTRKAISKRKPALMAAIRKFNKYCDTLTRLAKSETGNPTVPRPLTSNLEMLRDDPYLMEDVWVSPAMQEAPPWLTDSKVRKGIRAMLKRDRCEEERRHLGRDSDGMCRWFGRRLTAIELAIKLNTAPLLDEPLRQERESHLRLKDLWLTSLTSKHVLWSHIERASRTATALSGSGTLPSSDWVYQPMEPSGGLSEDSDSEWEDIPEFDSSQEMLVDVCEDIEEVEVVALDADWRVSTFLKYDTFEDVPLTPDIEGSPCAILDQASLSRLSCPTSLLNDNCMNECAKLLHSLFPSPQASTYALLSTYVLADHRNHTYDDHRTWRNSYKTQYWSKSKWIIPIHRLATQHWVLCVVNHVSRHIDFFDSLGEQSAWIRDIQDVMTLITRLERLAIDHGYSLKTRISGWTASPICDEVLQTNSYDCGLWVLSTIAAVFRGFDVSGLAETDIIWFRNYLLKHCKTK